MPIYRKSYGYVAPCVLLLTVLRGCCRSWPGSRWSGLVAGCLLWSTGATVAQHIPDQSLYLWNMQLLNPAYVGVPGGSLLTFSARTQWIGIKGQPNTFTASFQSELPALHGGLGLECMVDQIGMFSTTLVRGTYAFGLKLGARERTGLHLAVSPAVYFKSFDATQVRTLDETVNPRIQSLLGRVIGENGMDLAAGVYLYRQNTQGEEVLSFGVAGHHLLEPSVEDFNGIYTLGLQIYATAGGNWSLGRAHQRMGVYAQLAATEHTLQLMGLLRLNLNPLSFGVGWRGLERFGALISFVSFEVSPHFTFAYAYDYALNDLRFLTTGSHELSLRFHFNRPAPPQKPRIDVETQPLPNQE